MAAERAAAAAEKPTVAAAEKASSEKAAAAAEKPTVAAPEKAAAGPVQSPGKAVEKDARLAYVKVS